jgi:hypothetical protein
MINKDYLKNTMSEFFLYKPHNNDSNYSWFADSLLIFSHTLLNNNSRFKIP